MLIPPTARILAGVLLAALIAVGTAPAEQATKKNKTSAAEKADATKGPSAGLLPEGSVLRDLELDED